MNEMTRNELASKIAEFLRQETNFRDPALINEATPLLELGVLDSMTMLSLIAYCEEIYACNIPPEELSDESMRTPLTLADLVLGSRRRD